MSNNVYADNIANISLVDGVVRFDLITAVPAEEQGQMHVRHAESVITTLPGFLRIHEQMSNVVNELVQKGVLVRQEAATSQAATAIETSD
ncbi:MAG: hypothetical protein RIQ52_1416 [Pseudomonadota bacterium]